MEEAMTVARFMGELEGYYGAFQRAEQRKHVAAYLANEWDEGELPHLLKWALETIPARYNYVPDIAAFQELRPKLREWLYLNADRTPVNRQLEETTEQPLETEEVAEAFARLKAKLAEGARP